MPQLSPEDFGFAELALKKGILSMESLYRAMARFELDTSTESKRLGTYLVRLGRLTLDSLYEVLANGQGSLPRQPDNRSDDEVPTVHDGSPRVPPQTPALPAPTGIKCPFCHYLNELGALFCEQCKSDLTEVAAEPITPHSYPQVPPVPPPPPPPAPTNVTFPCSQCKKALQIPVQYLGRMVLCPLCGHQQTVQDRDEPSTGVRLPPHTRDDHSPTDRSDSWDLEISLDEEPAATHPGNSKPASPSAPPTPTERGGQPVVGSVVGGYRLVRLLGQGGMGTVYLGEHLFLPKQAAIKVIRPDRFHDPHAAERILREATLMARLNHPNIVSVYNAGREGDNFFVAMQYVGGGDVRRLLEEKGPLPLTQMLAIARDVTAALLYLHRHGQIHRDIKPGNIFLDESGRSLLGDFSLAKSLRGQEDSPFTRSGVVMGTPDYMGPEQAMGAHQVDIRADIYSLGCTLYHLLTGRAPFAGVTATLKLVQQMHVDPQPIEELRADVPAALAAMVRRMMAKRPEDRFQTPAELMQALESIQLLEPPPQAPLTAKPVPLPAPPPPEPPSFMTEMGKPPARQDLAEESIYLPPDLPAPPEALTEEHTIFPDASQEAESGHTQIRSMQPSNQESDPALEAAREWENLLEKDIEEAERFWLELSESLQRSPSLSAAREWYAQRQADRLFQKATQCRREGKLPEAIGHLRAALELAPNHREAARLLQELEAAPVLQLDQLKSLARAGKPQGIPALEAILRQHVEEEDIVAYLHQQPECVVYRDKGNLQEFLFENRTNTRERILGDLLSLGQLRQVAGSLGVHVPPGTAKDELISSILEAVGFRPLTIPEGLSHIMDELAVECRGLEKERDHSRLKGIGTDVLNLAERVLKDLVHFYASWFHGNGYLDVLRHWPGVPSYLKTVQKMSFGTLQQSFARLAKDGMEREESRGFFPPGVEILPMTLAKRLGDLAPQRNQVFSHDTPGTRKLALQELREITLEVRDVIQAFFRHLHATGVYPRKIVLDRTMQDRHGQISYCCINDENEEVEVITNQSLEMGQVYQCLSATNPRYLHPILIPELSIE